MSDGRLLVEKLVYYGVAHLYLNEYDAPCVRSRLAYALKVNLGSDCRLTEKQASEIDALADPKPLFGELVEYIRSEAVVGEDAAERHAEFIFGELTPLPSVVRANFKKFRELRGARAACNYLYGLSVMNGSVRKNAAEPLAHSVGSRVEVFALCDNSAREAENSDKAARDFSDNGLNCAEKKNSVGVEIGLSERLWNLQYIECGSINEHFALSGAGEGQNLLGGKLADALFDFIEYIPDYFIGAAPELSECGGSESGYYFQGGQADMPAFAAKPAFSLSSEEFPDVEIALTDWLISDLRISGFNRNTVKEVFSRVVGVWEKYSDEGGNSEDAETRRRNLYAVWARYLPDQKYCIDVAFLNGASYIESAEGLRALTKKSGNAVGAAGLEELMGVFTTDAALKAEISEIADFLSDKARVRAQNFADGETLLKHGAMVEEIVGEYGYIRDKAKAEAVVGDKIFAACAETLKRLSAFDKKEESTLALKKILSQANVK